MVVSEPHCAPCTDIDKRRLLFRYCARLASGFEQRAFESHVLDCELCFDDLVAACRVGELLEESARGSGDVHGTLPDLLRSARRRRTGTIVLVALTSAIAGFLLGFVSRAGL